MGQNRAANKIDSPVEIPDLTMDSAGPREPFSGDADPQGNSSTDQKG